MPELLFGHGLSSEKKQIMNKVVSQPRDKVISHHHQPAITWVVIADGQQADVFSCLKSTHKVPLAGANKHHYYDEKAGHELVPVPEGSIKAEPLSDYQIGHNRRGTSSSSNSPTHNTYEPGDINEELNRRFLQKISNLLQVARQAKLYDKLIIVAPGRMIRALKSQLSAELRKIIVGSLSKDLTPYHGQVLMSHLRETLTCAHIA